MWSHMPKSRCLTLSVASHPSISIPAMSPLRGVKVGPHPSSNFQDSWCLRSMSSRNYPCPYLGPIWSVSNWICLVWTGGSYELIRWTVFLFLFCLAEFQYRYMGVVRNSFFSKGPFLAKNNYFSQTFAISTKTFAGPYVGLYLGIFVRKQKLDKGNLPVWATIKTHSVAAAHSRVAFCLYRWSLLTFSGQFWHSHTETKGSPASCLSGNKT